jgi:hypothetical protein
MNWKTPVFLWIGKLMKMVNAMKGTGSQDYIPLDRAQRCEKKVVKLDQTFFSTHFRFSTMF